ncbi:MAG: preprotein translocase subunit SecA [Epulopiscium sp.]|uniref:Protein translocase subunit SecA n=1 Tax=Defluviitalea raffinosedens TaxID=1450156 RepID=A0A7C8HE91_9FIRM|nr:preprotein translocase subunit SecA [Defluviitalea raffinosedens]MBZ4667385.1 secA [Defluviitaleaceae bacterium]MDK2788466.1 preprotein translocase subunit SecA [Candidatus Epulonipiscium sp.]KAE9632017.1 preprotein translocase subunit SecA [Defluviitalea raffinosedens]MBM7686482.1 preprotein translocase subunit SecA [Defluviitalea raffinosedens]HHW66397.1 preprotein translocase subunit SecA [Candidatus Epulonipiscium sp.]
MKGLLEKIFGTHSERELKRIEGLVNEIEALGPQMESLSDAELRAKTDEFKKRLEEGQTLDDILPEAYAVVREAAYRVLGMRHFRVQLIGGIILHQGRIAEMKTGEGKTLVATLPAYLNALEGKGVHVVTVNDYLAKRDAEWMGKVHEFLGLSVGVILHDMDAEERRRAYNCDITYATNNELGFDYLRDNMVLYKEEMVQRDLHYAIIDEVDSVLIDEARTPLIISGSSSKSTHLYKAADVFVRRLQKGRVLTDESALNNLMRQEIQEEGDFVVDEKAKTVTLTEEGVKKAEQYFGLANLADPENMEIQHHINIALKAHHIMHLDKDYVIKDGEIVIVDEFTGRMMPGRRYSDGLHQAIEAKENVQVQRESKTLATITFQNFFNKYHKKCGMTGTALTEENEFREIYGMDVIVIPTNKPVIRIDHPDVVYKTQKAKFNAVVNEIEESYKKGQPVLVGTITIDTSEMLSQMLKKRGIKHQVLNAKYHEKEAEIVALAGQKGAVTIATNMAGRGTDIKLGEGVKELGGLKIIGTERHESRRIDNQLRGRSGRQGDPGESRFYISLEDDLMRLFGSDRISKLVETMGMPEDEPIEHKMLTKAIESAQKKVEGNNFSIRKHLLEYDRVMNDQREIIYSERRKVLEGDNLRDNIIKMVKEIIESSVDMYTGESPHADDWDIVGLREHLTKIMPIQGIEITKEEREDITKEALKEKIIDKALKLYEQKEQEIGEEQMREIERVILLRVIDQKWMDHIDNMDQMRQGIGLRAYGQRDPLVEYQFAGYDMFEEMSANIQEDTVRALYHVKIAYKPERERVAEPTSTNRGEESSVKTPYKRKEEKVGRNDPCPCGSGKKYKHCCGRNA